MSVGIVWFRQDLRLADNPALSAAAKACDELVCVFIDDPADQTISQLGAASRVWLHHSLEALDQQLQAKNQRLLLARGNSEDVLESIQATCNATRLFWNRCYDPVSIKRDAKIKKSLSSLAPTSFNALLFVEPWDALKGDGTPYRVYTPYWRMLSPSLPGKKPLSTPKILPPAPLLKKRDGVIGLLLKELSLLPERDWHESMMSGWKVGEKAAMSSLTSFLKSSVNDYKDNRDLPSVAGTSRLSPHLHFGEISPRQILHKLFKDKSGSGKAVATLQSLSHGEETFAKEILWREFAYSLLYHFPHTIKKPLDTRFDSFPWAKKTSRQLRDWQSGNTGVPIVDAGMRELYATGWMHNRVRMIVASYLIKNLLIPWQRGEEWFRDTLVDADLASNAMGWQWAAGSGADAAPYFRIFNPVLQGEKFDKSGEYVRRWVPEVAGVPDKYIHKPWELESSARAEIDYPEPLVDLKESRQRALKAFDQIKSPA